MLFWQKCKWVPFPFTSFPHSVSSLQGRKGSTGSWWLQAGTDRGNRLQPGQRAVKMPMPHLCPVCVSLSSGWSANFFQDPLAHTYTGVLSRRKSPGSLVRAPLTRHRKNESSSSLKNPGNFCHEKQISH